ncbi:hypothetical protein ABIC83_002820 [Roseateles asaccharophilus]|uniref:hypothetical protein n=1 Tax=Roseateles asaccharophilus TaxID=582607 RepID=UPI003837E475
MSSWTSMTFNIRRVAAASAVSVVGVALTVFVGWIEAFAALCLASFISTWIPRTGERISARLSEWARAHELPKLEHQDWLLAVQALCLSGAVLCCLAALIVR